MIPADCPYGPWPVQWDIEIHQESDTPKETQAALVEQHLATDLGVDNSNSDEGSSNSDIDLCRQTPRRTLNHSALPVRTASGLSEAHGQSGLGHTFPSGVVCLFDLQFLSI